MALASSVPMRTRHPRAVAGAWLMRIAGGVFRLLDRGVDRHPTLLSRRDLTDRGKPAIHQGGARHLAAPGLDLIEARPQLRHVAADGDHIDGDDELVGGVVPEFDVER